MKEIRSGRNIMCRKIMIGEPIGEQDCNISQVGITILFVHGSCAASKQFDDLVKSLSDINNQQKRITLYLYDQLGFGESKHPSDDWDAFSSLELGCDLHAITQNIIETMNDNSLLFLVGHSYGVSQAIKLLNDMDENKVSRVGGAVFIAGALRNGPSPSNNLTKDCHWIFRYLPMFALQKMQQSLSEGFFHAAVHPSNAEKLRETSLEISNQNEMQICKAFYRQQNYATSEEAQCLTTRAIVIHGRDDLVFHRELGEHLHKSLKNSSFHVIPETSHQVFQEEPAKVAFLLYQFICQN